MEKYFSKLSNYDKSRWDDLYKKVGMIRDIVSINNEKVRLDEFTEIISKI